MPLEKPLGVHLLVPARYHGSVPEGQPLLVRRRPQLGEAVHLHGDHGLRHVRPTTDKAERLHVGKLHQVPQSMKREMESRFPQAAEVLPLVELLLGLGPHQPGLQLDLVAVLPLQQLEGDEHLTAGLARGAAMHLDPLRLQSVRLPLAQGVPLPHVRVDALGLAQVPAQEGRVLHQRHSDRPDGRGLLGRVGAEDDSQVQALHPQRPGPMQQLRRPGHAGAAHPEPVLLRLRVHAHAVVLYPPGQEAVGPHDVVHGLDRPSGVANDILRVVLLNGDEHRGRVAAHGLVGHGLQGEEPGLRGGPGLVRREGVQRQHGVAYAPILSEEREALRVHVHHDVRLRSRILGRHDQQRVDAARVLAEGEGVHVLHRRLDLVRVVRLLRAGVLSTVRRHLCADGLGVVRHQRCGLVYGTKAHLHAALPSLCTSDHVDVSKEHQRDHPRLCPGLFWLSLGLLQFLAMSKRLHDACQKHPPLEVVRLGDGGGLLEDGRVGDLLLVPAVQVEPSRRHRGVPELAEGDLALGDQLVRREGVPSPELHKDQVLVDRRNHWNRHSLVEGELVHAVPDHGLHHVAVELDGHEGAWWSPAHRKIPEVLNANHVDPDVVGRPFGSLWVRPQHMLAEVIHVVVAAFVVLRVGVVRELVLLRGAGCLLGALEGVDRDVELASASGSILAPQRKPSSGIEVPRPVVDERQLQRGLSYEVVLPPEVPRINFELYCGGLKLRGMKPDLRPDKALVPLH
mmetsp:Transcript_85297/g.241701  ORF Transcript_85297/g.241701 Transcript_85297/m.241701 type:complete len:737 (+) Transcript_85297:2513-4723(+)